MGMSKFYVVRSLEHDDCYVWNKIRRQLAQWCKEHHIKYHIEEPTFHYYHMHWYIPDDASRTMFLLQWGGEVIEFSD